MSTVSRKTSNEPDPSLQGLRRLIQDRLMTDVFKPCNAQWEGWMILILDDSSTRIISNALGMYDLMENHVTLAENIAKRRAPFRDKAPLYLLTPTEENVDRLIADWTPSKTLKQPLYAQSVFLFFVRPLSPDLFDKIKACKHLTSCLKLFGEVNIDFLAKQARAFHLDMNSCFAELFMTVHRPSEAEVIIANKLVTVCATLNEFPHIRYRASSNVCASLASLFQSKLNEFVGKNKDWWYHGDWKHNSRGRATFLILSRENDCLSPLMHEFTYQAMVNDLLSIEDDKITCKSENFVEDDSGTKEFVDKDILLNENDDLWVELQSNHIADVIQTLSTRIRAIVNSNTTIALNAKGNESKSLSLNQLANALKALPEYREVMSKLSQHMHIAHQCMDIFNRQGLLELSELEQTLATGKNEEGKVPKISEIVSLIEDLLKKMPDSLSRLRLLSIFAISQHGLRSVDQSKLLAAARLDGDHLSAFYNLAKLEIPLVQAPVSGKMASLIATNKITGVREESDSEYTSSRYVCELKGILQQLLDRKLSLDAYPSILPLPEEGTSLGMAQSVRMTTISGSVRKKNSTFNRSRAADVNKLNDRPRLIVFIVGGACYSELRSAQEIMEKEGIETIIGSTHFVNPKEFAQALASL